MKRILFVDDDILPEAPKPQSPDDEEEACGDYMWFYQQALKDDPLFEVEAVDSAEKCLARLASCQKTPEAFDLVIVDIMMELPPRGTFQNTNEELNHDIFTGILLANDIRVKYGQIPIILLSNAVADQAPQKVLAEKLTENNVVTIVRYKPQTSPFRFREIVKQVLGM